MSLLKRLTPDDFASLGSVADPQLSQDGRYATYLEKVAGKTRVCLVDFLDPSQTKKFELQVKFPHPLGGGTYQLGDEGRELFYVDRSGGISRLDLLTEEISAVYSGPGVSQISLGNHQSTIAAVIFGNRVVLFDCNRQDPPATISERPRYLRQFTGITDIPDYVVTERPDFIIDVSLSRFGNYVVWHEWSLPKMPWQRSQIAMVDLTSAENPIAIVAGGDYYVSQPRLSRSGSRLGFLAETNQYLNLWIADLDTWKARQVLSEPFEHGSPPWGGGSRTFEFSSDQEKLFLSRNEGGFGRLISVSTESTEVEDLGKAHHFGLSVSSNSLLAIRTGAKTPNQVVKYDLSGFERVEVGRIHPDAIYDAADTEPESFTAEYSDELYSYITPTWLSEFKSLPPASVPYKLYRPSCNEDLPTLFSFHGGPTDQSIVTFSPRNIAFMQSGFQVVTFDYRGSTGWGKSHRESLDQMFGLAEVADLLSVMADMHRRGLIKSQPSVVNGGSSGGYSALRSLEVTRGLFSGAIAEYPLVDLCETVGSTHRLESRYFDDLIGRFPDQLARYKNRSITPSELDRVPLLIMHGDSDPVVSPNQVVEFVNQAVSEGLQVSFNLFKGEGHGFSNPENIAEEYRAYQDFLRSLKDGGGKFGF